MKTFLSKIKSRVILLQKILTMLKRQFIAHTVSIIFLIVSFVISILLISIGTSAVVSLKESAIIKENATPKNALGITYSFSTKKSFDEQLRILTNISKNSGLMIPGNYLFFAEDKLKHPLTAIFFQEDSKWTYPYYDGRYFDINEIKAGSNVILIGKNLLKFTYISNGKRYLRIEGTKYEVIGTIGIKNKYSTWDSRLLMPLTSVPQSIKSRIESNSSSIILYNDLKFPIDDFNVIKDEIINTDKDASITATELDTNQQNIILDLLTRQDTLLMYSLFIYFTALINLINITSYWINGRRYEIGVRKAFGHNNYQISIMLFAEMFLVLIISCFIALFIQTILNQVFNNLFDYPLGLTYINGIIAIVITLITSIATSLIPIIKAFTIQPIEIIKK